ncbi:hypothetical protein AFE02nite_30200 [Actinotalea fermentans]|uniref:Oligosaccharide repeat unit polymerase n=1 Tax=Actinotalea fermentans TaxID=43671 RepID=A0A511Z1N7_9CELL|nr:hypothetical protein AFE02nite_30200 [Actinotalea fermentans]
MSANGITGQISEPAAGERADSAVVPVNFHWLWAPGGLMVILAIPAVVWTFLLPPDAFPVLFGQPAFLNASLRSVALLYCSLMLAVFLVGSPARGRYRGSIRLGPSHLRWLDQAVRSTTAVTIGAYLLWFGIAVARGLRPGDVIALLSGTRGSMYVLRNNYFESVGGVTTWMQIGAIVVPLAVLRARAGGRSARNVILTVAALALLRAVLNSERLALIEILASWLVASLILRSAPPPVLRRAWGGPALIVGTWVSLFAFFGVFEFFRSWATVRDSYGGSFWAYVQNLLLGYYATALNNSGFDHYLLGRERLPSALFDGDIYDSVFGPSPIEGAARVYGLETYTNRSGVLSPYVALGLLGGALVVVAVALWFNVLARRAARGRVVATVVYCASAVGLLEFARIFYFGSSRFLPVVVAGAVLSVWFRVVDARARTASTLGAGQYQRLVGPSVDRRGAGRFSRG